MLAFILGTGDRDDRRLARGGTVDNVLTPTFMSLGAFPAFFSSLLAVYFLGLKFGWFPIQHAYDLGTEPGFNWDFLSSAFRHAQLPILIIVFVYAGGWLLGHAQRDDQHGRGGLRRARPREGPSRLARDDDATPAATRCSPPLTGFAAQFGSAVGGLIFIEYVFSYPGAGLTLQQAALGSDYPLTQALLLFFAVCVLVANLSWTSSTSSSIPRVRSGLSVADRSHSSLLRPTAIRRRAASARSPFPPRRGDAAGSRLPGWLRPAAREPEVVLRHRRLHRHRRSGPRGAAARAELADRARRAARPAAEPGLLVRDDRPGLRRLLAGRLGRAHVARRRRRARRSPRP